MGFRILKDGTVYNTETRNIMKISVNQYGYPQVKCGSKMYTLHRLLARAFIPNPNNYPIVKHLDHNKLNYSLDNLQWDTQQQNTEDSIAKTYTVTTPNGECITFTNMNKFCREHNLTSGNMHKVLKGVLKQHKGYTK